MISVVIPFYNAEPTLERCVKSVLEQTYPDLEIILVNDGSTDRSSAIAECFANSDARVVLLTKENGGLSSARNYGLDRMKGEWVAFVDADDWIERNTFETALEKCQGADICVFGRSVDSPNRERRWAPTEKAELIDGETAIRRMIVDGTIGHAVWDKIYHRELFDSICFPTGHNYEDARTTYRLLQKAQSIRLIPDICYHYLQNAGSIDHTFSIKNRLDHWSAYYELYQVFAEIDESFKTACVRQCAISMFYAWSSLWKATSEELKNQREYIDEIKSFVKEHRSDILHMKGCKAHAKITALLIPFGNRFSMLCVHALDCIYRRMKPMNVFEYSS